MTPALRLPKPVIVRAAFVVASVVTDDAALNKNHVPMLALSMVIRRADKPAAFVLLTTQPPVLKEGR